MKIRVFNHQLSRQQNPLALPDHVSAFFAEELLVFLGQSMWAAIQCQLLAGAGSWLVPIDVDWDPAHLAFGEELLCWVVKGRDIPKIALGILLEVKELLPGRGTFEVGGCLGNEAIEIIQAVGPGWWILAGGNWCVRRGLWTEH